MSQLELGKLGATPPEMSRIAERRRSTSAGPGQVSRADMAAALQDLESSLLRCLADRDGRTERLLAELAERVDAGLAADEPRAEAQDLDDINLRFVMAHDEVMGVKADLGNLQRALRDSLLLKADEKDLAELRRSSDVLQVEAQQVRSVLQEANRSMSKYDDCLRELDGCKAQAQELLRLFQSECQEIRDWTTGSLTDLRSSTMEKIHQVQEAGLVDDLRRELRDSVARQLEASERCQADVRHKA
ncbi:unnamed protein product, partial [Prorocentrum cordatum]